MNNTYRNIRYLILSSLSIILLSFSFSTSASTVKGLKLQYDSENISIYLKPGINFEVYKSIKIEAVTVELNNKWLRKYNYRLRPISSRINDDDVKAIKKRVAGQFSNSFINELQENSGYNLVQSNVENTLLIKPAIIDLVIKSPVKKISSNAKKSVRTAGSATLESDIYDLNSGQLLGKIIDKQNTRVHEQYKTVNREFNKREFIPVYQSWAKNLNAILKIKQS